MYYARMSPLAPFRNWTLSAGIAIALVVTLPLVSIPRVAHADLGDEPSSKSTSDQVEDTDKPKDSSLLEKKPADAAVEQQKLERYQQRYEEYIKTAKALAAFADPSASARPSRASSIDD